MNFSNCDNTRIFFSLKLVVNLESYLINELAGNDIILYSLFANSSMPQYCINVALPLENLVYYITKI